MCIPYISSGVFSIRTNVQLLTSTNEVGYSMETNELHWVPDGEETSEGVDEAGCI